MRITSNARNETSRLMVKSFHKHAALFLPSIGLERLSIQFGDRNGAIVAEGCATIMVDIGNPVFQDSDAIDPFACQEIIRIKTRRAFDAPGFVEDIICGREAAGICRGYFQLCYLDILCRRKITSLGEFLGANRHWIIFYPVDSYDSDMLKKMAERLHHDRRLEAACRPLFNASKSSLSSSEKLKYAVRAYERLSEGNAGNKI